MGEAKNHRKSHQNTLDAAKRCVYCTATTNLEKEHMPPTALFENKDRPPGWVFACCKRCNQGTRGTDAVVQFFSRIEPVSQEKWKLATNLRVIGAIKKYAPGVMDELFGETRWASTLFNKNGLLYRSKVTRANGPAMKWHLNLFAAKAAMAAFHEFTGRPIRMDGLIYTEWFLNAGMSQETHDVMISVMPGCAQLKQGKKTSGKQFNVKYNTNGTDIVAALLSFHESFHITIIATDNPELSQPLSETFADMPRDARPTIQLTRPGLPELD